MARKSPTSPPPKSSSARPTSNRPARGNVSARQARVAEVKKAQQSRERRTVLMIVAACAVLVLALAAVITYGILDARKNQPDNLIVALGTPAASASCDAATTDAASGNSDHVGPGTNRTDVSKVQYSTVPPTSGSHFVQPVLDGRQFYSSADTPAVETLVHNLEHGYTVVWYRDSAPQSDVDALSAIAKTFTAEDY
ncbi:MAG TPA: DUF3105 domain-containing protein, partial [Actinomycetes bacterium]|nr:DUF3105 domain-containing protein [Actinomycetes bacterium]